MELAGPIGIFDSGVGGLTVVLVIKRILPYESIFYVGDTANFPYGDKSTQQIQSYVSKIAHTLLAKSCKVIVIACNTATAAAADFLVQQIGSQVPILNVVDPLIAYLKKAYSGKRLGLIGTQYTVDSNFYVRKLQAAHVQANLQCLATPLLVPMIETGAHDVAIIAHYLSDPVLESIEGLILACTHYWLIKKHIATYYQHRIELIHGAELLAFQLRQLLIDKKMLNPRQQVRQDCFSATRITPGFQIITHRLFGAQVELLESY